MSVIDDRIVKFIKKHHVLTLATSSEAGVWCCNLFYAYHAGRLIFTSKRDTRHIAEGENRSVAASIVLESKIIGNLKGAQIVGHLISGEDADKAIYLKRFPYAALSLESMWVISITSIKFTDNKLGFGTKLHFQL